MLHKPAHQTAELPVAGTVLAAMTGNRFHGAKTKSPTGLAAGL
jgi:hypothetical protein